MDVKKQPWSPVNVVRLHAPLKAMKSASELLLLTIYFFVFQSIEREEPIEVDHAPTHAGLENGHAVTTGI